MGRPEGRWALRAAWALVAVAVAVALVVGSSGKSRPQSLYQRAVAIDAQYKCPVCQGESVAASNAPEAVEIRSLITRWLTEGRSPSQIRSYLVADYGTSILERPPATGLGILLWALPVAISLLGAVGLALAFWRWRSPAPGAAAAPARDGLAVAEVPAGSRDDDAPSPPPGPVRSRWAGPARSRGGVPSWYQRATLLAGLVLVALAGALWYADRSSAPRLPGGTVSGGPPAVDVGAQLAQAAALSAKNPTAALLIYSQVLAEQPNQPTALTEEGWIYAEAGFSAKGMALLGQAESTNPRFDLAHLYRGLVLLDYRHDPAGAVREFNWYLAHGPDASLAPLAHRALAEARAHHRS